MVVVVVVVVVVVFVVFVVVVVVVVVAVFFWGGGGGTFTTTMIITIITIHRLLCVFVVVVVPRWAGWLVGWMVAWLLFHRLFFVLGVSWVVALSSPSFSRLCDFSMCFAPRNLKRVAKELGERMTDEELQVVIDGGTGSVRPHWLEQKWSAES